MFKNCKNCFYHDGKGRCGKLSKVINLDIVVVEAVKKIDVITYEKYKELIDTILKDIDTKGVPLNDINFNCKYWE